MEVKTLAEALAQSPEKPEFFEWTFPGSPVRVRLKLDIVPGMLGHLMQNIEADIGQPHQEAGGILLGEIQGNCVEVSGFDPFVCSQQHNPLFVVTDNDRARFQETIDRWNQPDSHSQAIGYCRSQVGKTLSLHDDDVSLIDAAFQNPFHVFLLVQPADTDRWPVASFFFRDGGKVFTESVLPFPFDQALLETEARSALLRTVESEDEPEPAIPPPAGVKERRPYLALTLAAVVLSVAALAATLYPGKKVLPGPAGGSSLVLSAEPNQDGIAIVWDPALPVIRNARVGILSFQDETKREEVPLSVAAMRTGQFVYKSEGKTLRVTLEVYSAEGQRTKEMLMVVAIARADSDSGIAAARTPGPPPSLPSVSTTQTPAGPPEELLSRNPPPQFKLPARDRQEPTPTSIFAIEPPALERRPVLQAQVVPPLPAVVTPGAPPPTVVASPAADSGKEQPAQVPAPLLVAAAPTPVPTIPPKPVQQIRPELPANVKRMLQSEVSVQVHVAVDAAGRVTKATPLPTKSAIAEYAAKAAATAVLLWRFDPSHRGGQAVPGEVVVEFRFAPVAAKRW